MDKVNYGTSMWSAGCARGGKPLVKGKEIFLTSVSTKSGRIDHQGPRRRG